MSPGEPDPPKKMEVLEITKNSATLGWLKPLRDGGAKINGYVVDYQEDGSAEGMWTPYSVVKDMTIVVVGLKEGTKYKFRVAARNSVGVSLAREAEGVFEVKEQLSEFTCTQTQTSPAHYIHSEKGTPLQKYDTQNLHLGL